MTEVVTEDVDTVASLGGGATAVFESPVRIQPRVNPMPVIDVPSHRCTRIIHVTLIVEQRVSNRTMVRVGIGMRRLADDLLHLVAPNLCPGCDELLCINERGYCRVCRVSLDPAPFPREIMSEMIARYDRDELSLAAIGALYDYEPESPARHLIHALKYRGCYALGVEMGSELARALTMFNEFDGVDVVVPVPLHRAKMRERGYNQAAAVADGIAAVLKATTVTHALVRTRHTTSQTVLDAMERRTNIRGAFRVVGTALKNRSVLLCDDVCTTGATLNACAEQLLAAGARRVVAATVAKGSA